MVDAKGDFHRKKPGARRFVRRLGEGVSIAADGGQRGHPRGLLCGGNRGQQDRYQPNGQTENEAGPADTEGRHLQKEAGA